MGSFRFLTAGESHGKGLTMVVEGVPAGLPLGEDDIAGDLRRRQGGYGRGGRMTIFGARPNVARVLTDTGFDAVIDFCVGVAPSPAIDSSGRNRRDTA